MGNGRAVYFLVQVHLERHPLCLSCHDEFDLASDTKYVFFPTDLRFFIDFEMKDRKWRQRDTETGHIIMDPKIRIELEQLRDLYSGDEPKNLSAAFAIYMEFLPNQILSDLWMSRAI
jgi:hypothetical protein